MLERPVGPETPSRPALRFEHAEAEPRTPAWSRHSRRKVAALLLALSIIAGSGFAHAQSSVTSSLNWVRLPGAEACVGSQALGTEVEALLGRSIFVSSSSAEIAVEARIGPLPEADATFEAVLAVSAADGTILGERTLRHEGPCPQFTETLAVVIALLIDPDAELDPSDPEEPERAAAAPSPEPQPDEPVEPHPLVDDPTSDPEPMTGDRYLVEISAVAGVSVGMVPNPALHAAATLLIEPPWFIGVELEAGILPYSEHERDGVESVLVAPYLGVLFCPRILALGESDRSDFDLRLCGGVQSGALFHIPEAGDNAETVTVQLIARVRATIRLTEWLRFTVRAAALLPLRPDDAYPPGVAPSTVAAAFDAGAVIAL
ncbi:MAG: hypothetical protein AAGF12_14100 [Myxococcota bacterium]